MSKKDGKRFYFKGRYSRDGRGRLAGKESRLNIPKTLNGKIRALGNLVGEGICNFPTGASRKLVLPLIAGLLGYHGGRHLMNIQEQGPMEVIVFPGESQVDNKYILLRDPNSNPENDPNKPTVYRRRDLFRE